MLVLPMKLCPDLSSKISHQQQALNAPHQPTGMFTRNLIGALSASAFRLHDQNHKFGIWFILQDLSIRTDGIFRYTYSQSRWARTS